MTPILDGAMLWRQFAVAIDQLGEALRDCPDDLWEARLWPDEPDQWVAKGFGTFWYLGYHTLFWLDLYLTGAEEASHRRPRSTSSRWWTTRSCRASTGATSSWATGPSAAGGATTRSRP